MEKSQKQIKILTKGGKEVVLKMKKIMAFSDEVLEKLVKERMTNYLASSYSGDDDLDYEPYNSIFTFLTGDPQECSETNLFEDLGWETTSQIEDEGFTKNGKEYNSLLELVDEWLEQNYPKTWKMGNSMIQAWDNETATNKDEYRMLYECALNKIATQLIYNTKHNQDVDLTQTITLAKGFEIPESLNWTITSYIKIEKEDEDEDEEDE